VQISNLDLLSHQSKGVLALRGVEIELRSRLWITIEPKEPLMSLAFICDPET
jgi:hypothetical protein